MPLSKAKNRERMREIRLHKHMPPPYQSKPVQPKPCYPPGVAGYDADGNPIYED